MAKPDFEAYVDEEDNNIELSQEPSKLTVIDKEIEPKKVEKIEVLSTIEKEENEPFLEEKKEKKRDTSEGWDQGNGRRAAQLVIYESNIPPHIKNKIIPHKGTHFKFVKKEDENELIRMIQGRDNFTAIYSPNKKKDITITRSDGTLIGNIHLLHVNSPDIHNSSKYYIKIYLFNFENTNELRKIKDRIQNFFNKLEQSKNKNKEHNFIQKKKITYKRPNTKYNKKYKIYTKKHMNRRIIKNDDRNNVRNRNKTRRKLNEMRNRLMKRRSYKRY